MKFPVRIRIAIPELGLGLRFDEIHRWLRARLGHTGFAMTGGTMPGFDATFIYFPDVLSAYDFMATFPDLEYAAEADLPLN
ncbi:hypothetical protein [Martelella sp. HB161492]|uniref:hypothetical protein n=1 Tax=Martelella sp. HB161492 TaxID=2720726 RepID=UPI00158FCE37|nr:hypothetical protein [Martelella sp. HB161492]